MRFRKFWIMWLSAWLAFSMLAVFRMHRQMQLPQRVGRFFWLGVFAVLLATGYNVRYYAPDISDYFFASRSARAGDLFGTPPPDPAARIATVLNATFELFVRLLLAAAAGYIGVSIYDQSQKQTDR